MIYYLAQWIRDWGEGTSYESLTSPFRVFKYVSLRSAGAATTALFLSWGLGPRTIRWLIDLKIRQMYKDRAELTGKLEGRIDNLKIGTPTMGGVLIVIVLDLTVILWAQWNALVVLTLLCLIVLAALGFYDDYLKITRKTGDGVQSKIKLVVQLFLGLFVGLYLLRQDETRELVSNIMVPFYKHPVLTGAPLVGLAITVVAIMGSSNAVNLTDGLDGLAIGCVVIVSGVFLILTYVADHITFSNYLQVPNVPGATELTVFCAALMGTSLGFLWYNCHPAKVFMGDTGSLALGGALGVVAVLIHQPFILVIAGGVFVAEALSVMIQTSWFKYTRIKYGQGRRIFLMAPLHHHFEKLGWKETQVVMRFYILCLLCAVVALSSLKIR